MVFTDEQKLIRRKEAQHRYYLKNKEKYHEKTKNWRENNKEQWYKAQATYSHTYYQKNKEQISERCKERYQLKKITI
jgi:hypothetical protein